MNPHYKAVMSLKLNGSWNYTKVKAEIFQSERIFSPLQSLGLDSLRQMEKT